MTDSWLDSDDFPSGPGGLGVESYSTWVHPQTKVVYFWDPGKNSWKTLNSPGAKMYSDTIDPALEGVQLLDGDLWWDQRLCELRVYHKPPTLDSSDPVQGRWVSSTNPEMSPEDPNRNLVIGKIEISGKSTPFEGEETMFQITRPQGGAPESYINYEWRSAPEYVERNVDGVLTKHYITFSNPNSAITNVTAQPGTAIFDGDFQVTFNVSCKLSAKEEYSDQFVSESKSSPAIRLRPVPLEVDPLQYIGMRIGLVNQDGVSEEFLAFNDGSTQVITGDGNFSVDSTLLSPQFFVIPINSLQDDTAFAFKFATKPFGQATQNDIISTERIEYGPIVDIPTEGQTGDAFGYLLSIGNLNINNQQTIYVWNDLDSTLQGELILT
jgi:hypothetical protein